MYLILRLNIIFLHNTTIWYRSNKTELLTQREHLRGKLFRLYILYLEICKGNIKWLCQFSLVYLDTHARDTILYIRICASCFLQNIQYLYIQQRIKDYLNWVCFLRYVYIQQENTDYLNWDCFLKYIIFSRGIQII